MKRPSTLDRLLDSLWSSKADAISARVVYVLGAFALAYIVWEYLR